MINIRHFILILILVFLCCINSVSASSKKDAEITNFIVSKKNNNLYLSFSVQNAFTQDIENLIKSGIPVTFSFDIEVYKKRTFFFDKTILNKEIIHKLKYSSLTKTYFIKKPYISQDPYLINSKKRSESEMTRIIDFPLEIKKTDPNATYMIRARARLQEITLPLYIHKIFFFLSAWDFKTDWYELNLKF